MPTLSWPLPPEQTATTTRLQNELGIHPALCALLVQRGITDYAAARKFFRPAWEDLHNPFLMHDMDAAVDRLERAVAGGERILLYGDYDVDGTMAVSLLYEFLQARHPGKLDYYFPDRYREGYGLSKAGVAYARDSGASLIIALDCGIRDLESAAYARELGIDLVVCDHHLPGDTLPAAVAVLDPQRPGCGYPYRWLSGAGVAFKLCQAYLHRQGLPATELTGLLDLLVISIAADIVPMTGENRVLAHLGLAQLNASERPGLRALIVEAKRRRPLRISDIVFGLGPMINAAGRMGDADQAVKLMLTSDRTVAHDHARKLAQRNQLRREFDRRTYEEARALWLSNPHHQQWRSIVLYQPHWHRGVIGIVAARLAEEFQRPTVILTRSDEKLVGSGRTVRGFDLYAALAACDNVLGGFGGHAHAAGLSLSAANLEAFVVQFEAAADTLWPAEGLGGGVTPEVELPLDQLTPRFYRILRQFAPFGPGNRNPVFVARGVQAAADATPLKGGHLRLWLRQANSPVFGGIAFAWDQTQAGGEPSPPPTQGGKWDLCYTVEENHWQGETRLQLVVKDWAISLP